MASRDSGSSMERSQRKIMEAVAKLLRFNIPTKPAIIKGEKVEYFAGIKAVDCLMESKWTKEPKNPDSDEPYFINRSFAVDYCNKLLREKFFVRAEKQDVKAKSDQGSFGDDGKGSGSTVRKRGGEQSTDSPRSKKQVDNGEKRKRKFRLDAHRQQIFLDSKEDAQILYENHLLMELYFSQPQLTASFLFTPLGSIFNVATVYFWTYDPPSYTTYLIGFAVVVGAIALTLQPLWPDSSRDALWYLSVVVFFVMGFLVLLIIARWVIYGTILVVTVGKLKFWILPNLDNEKTGFVESFKPIYSVEWTKKKKNKKGKSTDSATEKLVEMSKESGGLSETKSEQQSEVPSNGNHKSLSELTSM